MRGRNLVTSLRALSDLKRSEERCSQPIPLGTRTDIQLKMGCRVAALLAMTVLMGTPSFAEEPEQKKQLEQTLQTLEKTKKVQAALAEKETYTRRELEVLQGRSTDLAEKLQQSERRVSKEEHALQEITLELADKEKKFEARKAEYARTVSTLLRMQDMPVTALFAQKDNLPHLLNTASVLEQTNKAVAERAQQLREDLVQLKMLKVAATARRNRTHTETVALDAERDKLAAAIKERQQIQAQLTRDRGQAEQKIASLSRESESLQTLIAKLDAQARAEAAKAKQSQPKPGRIAKGNLRLPVAGDLIHRFGEQKTANETYRGLVIRSRAGATVIAPEAGEIVFTGPFRDYGNIVLIKHANNYISLMSGLGKTTASLNQKVIRGEPVATMAAEKSPELYVELRDESAKPIDPGNWFAKVNR